LGATFDDELIKEVATVISTEARAFNNAGRSGLDYFTPNINPFKDPRWGRGQETPGEDPYHISRYVYQLIDGLQGGIDPRYWKTIADCKHFAAYDLEDWKDHPRYGFNAVVTRQDLAEYYLPPFQACVRDAKVASVMCSYNAVNGVPACANPYLLQTILREEWGFNDDGRWVTSDCDAIHNVYADHHYTEDYVNAAAVSLKAGTDVNCGWPGVFTEYLPTAYNQSLVKREDLEKAVARLYSSLVR
jgi:beta-D-xylosidase 4